MKIGFIGAGNMGGAILKGYAAQAKEAGNEILVFDPNKEKMDFLNREYGASPKESVKELVFASDVVMVGIKPNIFEKVMPEVAEAFTPDKTLISMAAGINIDLIEGYLGKEAKVIRIMPNTPAQVNAAMVAVCRNKNVDDALFDKIFKIFEAVGRAEEIDEDLIHCVIGVSGSSPAYTFMYIDALTEAAAENGMDYHKAKIFAAQAVLGAAKMVLETEEDPKQLKINVCSPGGTTIEAVKTLEKAGFEDDIKEAFQAAVEKSKIMSK